MSDYRLLGEIRVGGEARLAELRDRLVERSSRDAVARLDELREFRRGHGVRIHARADQRVRDHVRGRDAVGARRRGLVPQTVEPACHQHGRALEVECRLDPADPRRRRLGNLRPERVDELAGRLDRHEVGLREVAVVVRLFLRAPSRERPGRRVEVVGLLLDLAARLPDPDLALDLGVDPAGDEVERVHVLDLRARPQLVGAGRPDGDVGVDAQRPLLHLRVGDPELDDRLAQELEEPLRLLGGADVRRSHDLDERRAAAVVVDERGLGPADPPRASPDMHDLRCILLEVGAHDPDHAIAFRSR